MKLMESLGWLPFALMLGVAAPSCTTVIADGGGSSGSGVGGAGGSGGGTGGSGGGAARCEGAPPGQPCGTDAVCDGTGHCIVILASSQNSPTAIAVDAESVYWTNAADDGSIMKCGVNGCGGAPTTLATGQVSPIFIALDGTHVYWGNRGLFGTDGAVLRCPTAGCDGAPQLLESSVSLGGLAVDAAHLYFTEITPMGSDGAGLVLMCPSGGCAGNPSLLAAVDGVPEGLAMNGTSLAWGAAPAGPTQTTGAVLQCAPTGCLPTAIASGPSITPRTLAMDASNVYFINGDFSVAKSALAGGDAMAPTTLASLDGLNIPYAIATDGVHVYWTVVAMGGTPSVMKCPVAGCDNQPTTLAAGPMVIAPYGIAVDATHVYWTDAAGTVMKTQK